VRPVQASKGEQKAKIKNIGRRTFLMVKGSRWWILYSWGGGNPSNSGGITGRKKTTRDPKTRERLAEPPDFYYSNGRVLGSRKFFVKKKRGEQRRCSDKEGPRANCWDIPLKVTTEAVTARRISGRAVGARHRSMGLSKIPAKLKKKKKSHLCRSSLCGRGRQVLNQFPDV